MYYPPAPKEPISDDEVTPDIGIQENGSPNTMTCPDCLGSSGTCKACKGRGRLVRLTETRTKRGIFTTYGAG